MDFKVKDIMITNLVTIDAEKSVYEAAMEMKKHNISSLLVEEETQIVGIITHSDMALKAILEDQPSSIIKISSVMTKPLKTIGEECGLDEALHIMMENDIKKLAVVGGVEGTRVVGIISIYDVTKFQPEMNFAYKKHLYDVYSKMRHDLRASVSAIYNSAHLIEIRPDRSHEFTPIIKKSCSYMEKILDDWKRSSVKMELVKEGVFVYELVREAVGSIFVPEGVEIDIESSETKRSHLDKNKMLRVLVNLLKNSVEAMPAGGNIRVTSETLEDEIIIRVEDTGAGIPEEVIGKIFNPMFSTKPTGLGLGLSYVKEVVEAHMGSISVESIVDVGTSFTIRIPLINDNYDNQ
jgi:signal transduction histidine kinase